MQEKVETDVRLRGWRTDGDVTVARINICIAP